MLGYYNKLPHYVYIKNEKFVVNSDYRIFIEFETEMQGKDKKKAIYTALKNFYPAFFFICEKGLLDEAINKFIWFYKCGKDEYHNETKSSKKGKKVSQIFNYEYDCDLICGSFLLYAHIDLHKYCHWWKFKEVWNTLPNDCEFCKIKGYRAYEGKDEKLLELKEYYKLPPTEVEIQEQIRKDKIYEAFK